MKTVSTYLRALAATAFVAAGLSTPAQAIDLIDNFDAARDVPNRPRQSPSSRPTRPAIAKLNRRLRHGRDRPGVLAGCNTCGTNCNGCSHGCGQCCDGVCLPWCSEECPSFGFITSGGFEPGRCLDARADAAKGNFGYVSSMNIAFPLVRDFGIAGQFGMSHGVYDWMGRTSNGNNEANQVQQQLMFTYGFFPSRLRDSLPRRFRSRLDGQRQLWHPVARTDAEPVPRSDRLRDERVQRVRCEPDAS